jgi:hypothetical protein
MVQNAYNYELNLKKKITLSEKVLNCKGDTKQFHRLVAELSGAKSGNLMSSENSYSVLAENFVDFFMNKGDKIRQP